MRGRGTQSWFLQPNTRRYLRYVAGFSSPRSDPIQCAEIMAILFAVILLIRVIAVAFLVVGKPPGPVGNKPDV